MLDKLTFITLCKMFTMTKVINQKKINFSSRLAKFEKIVVKNRLG